MNKCEIFQNDRRFKIVTYRNKKHPLLMYLGRKFRAENKYAQNKIGCYSVYRRKDSQYVWVYSYIARRTDKMSRKQYDKFLHGTRQLKPIKPLIYTEKDKIELKELESLFV